MNNFLKKITGFALLLLILAPVLLFLGFSIKQKLIQVEIRDKMETSRLQTITIKMDKLQWVNERKEILISGKLFDVEFFTVSNDNIILTGLFDGKEDELQQHFENFFQHKNNSPLNQLAFKFLFFPIYSDGHNSLSENNLLPSCTHFFFPYTENIFQGKSTILAPPPRARYQLSLFFC